MAVIGLIVHQRRPAAAESALDLLRWLTAAGHEVRLPPEEADAIDCTYLKVTPDRFADGLDVVVTLGGDGSILRAVELIGTSGVPVLGVDFGELGYLSEVQPQEARSAIERFLSNDFRIEYRLLLVVEVHCPRHVDGQQLSGVDGQQLHKSYIALNEAFIERGPAFNTIRLQVHIDGHMFTTYSADGLIVATPTGSTAYAFSVRGPIIDPAHKALILTPVSPHMLFDRALVVPPATRLRIAVAGHRSAMLSVDGRRVAELRVGDSVDCSASQRSARFVTFGTRRFHQVLKQKFGLGGPQSPEGL